MKGFIKECIKANREISDFINTTSHKKLCKDVGMGSGGDMSHFVDVKAEKIFIKYLKNFGQIYSEEIGVYGKKSPVQVVIDPIDGSDNFISQVPYFGSSVALKKNGKTLCGIVCNFANGDIFIKTKKRFKTGNLKTLDFTDVKSNNFSSVGVFERAYCSEVYAPKLQSLKIKFRSLGALALSLAYANRVNFVLYEGKVREFDIAAGWYMCEGLYRKKTENYLFVSKDKQNFDKIHEKLLKVG